MFIGIIGGEAQCPRFSMAHATKLVPFRVFFVYMTSIVFVTLLVSSNDDRLLGGSGVTASPFVAIQSSGIPGISSLLNAGIIAGLVAIAAEAIYISSRILRTMAHQGLIPERFAKVDALGRPRWALFITLVTGVFLAYISLSGKYAKSQTALGSLPSFLPFGSDRKLTVSVAAGGSTALTWLISITSASYFTNWLIIAFVNWRFHVCLKAQNDPLFSEIYAWRSSLWPLAPASLFSVSFLLLVCCFAAGINPVVSCLSTVSHSFFP